MKAHPLVLLSMLSLNASADEISPAWYAGVSAGLSHSRLHVSTLTPYIEPGYTATTYWDDPVNAANVSESGTASLSSSDAVGGIFGGFDSRFSARGFWGIEIGFLGFSSRQSETQYTTYPGFIGYSPQTSIALEQENMGYLAGRLGIKHDDLTIYAKAGTAVSKMRFNLNFDDGSAHESNEESGYEFGWIAGIGAEKDLGSGWGVRAEYLHADFGSISQTSNNLTDIFSTYTATPFKTKMDVKNDMIGIGIVRHF